MIRSGCPAKMICMLVSLAFVLSAVSVSASGLHGMRNEEVTSGDATQQPFKYVHDPEDNPAAMADIVRDENAVYGFRPSETGSLKQYADADWSDPEIVEQGRQDRIAYHESIAGMYDMLREMLSAGRSTEEIARAVSTRRNELRLEACNDDPEALAIVKERNLEKYGHEEGPLPEELFEQYGSWETVLLKAFSPNPGMDACLGLYDKYYDLYVALGQIKDDEVLPTEDIGEATDGEVAPMSPQTGYADAAAVYAVIMFISASLAVKLAIEAKKKEGI